MDTKLNPEKEFREGVSRAELFPLQASCYLPKNHCRGRLTNKTHTKTNHSTENGKVKKPQYLLLFFWQPGGRRFYLKPPCRVSTLSSAAICLEAFPDSQRGILGPNRRMLGEQGERDLLHHAQSSKSFQNSLLLSFALNHSLKPPLE